MVAIGILARVQTLVVGALLASSYVNAFPFASNPYTAGDDIIALDKRHPALGAAVPKDSRANDIVIPGGNDTVGAEGENREAISNTDIERLEAFFQSKMEVNYDRLLPYRSGSAETPPWPSSYWATYEDGINFAWNPNDKMPPSEKYARAYGLDPKDFMNKVSQASGILAQSSRKACTSADECKDLKDGSTCAKRAGETSGFCIPKWFGVCHAWAPAAIEEKEPRCAVTKKGINFQPFDIKALITQAYDGMSLGTVFTGTRFNGQDDPENLDSDGRFKDPTRRDIGPGFFHIAIANIMGMRRSSFIVDVTAGAEVWNQPVRAYDAYTMMEVSKEQALQTFFPGKKEYDFNPAAKKLIFVQTKFQYIVEASVDGPLVSTNKVDAYTTTVFYEYLLELDGNNDIIGGEWVRSSKKDHPDFLWFPQTPGQAGAVTDIGIKYDEVRELLDASAACTQLDDPNAATPAPVPAPTPSQSAAAGDADSSATTPSASSAAGDSDSPSDAPASDNDTPAPGTVAPDSGSIEAMIAEWVKRWMAGRGRGN